MTSSGVTSAMTSSGVTSQSPAVGTDYSGAVVWVRRELSQLSSRFQSHSHYAFTGYHSAHRALLHTLLSLTWITNAVSTAETIRDTRAKIARDARANMFRDIRTEMFNTFIQNGL